MENCAICLEDITIDAKVTTECGHHFHTRCLLNSVARNTGSEEGTSRNMCPNCREEICSEVLPSETVRIRIDDLEEELSEAETESKAYMEYVNKLNTKISDYQKRLIESRQEALEARKKWMILEDECARYKDCHTKVRARLDKVEEDLDVAKFINKRRRFTIDRLHGGFKFSNNAGSSPNPFPFTWGLIGNPFSSHRKQRIGASTSIDWQSTDPSWFPDRPFTFSSSPDTPFVFTAT